MIRASLNDDAEDNLCSVADHHWPLCLVGASLGATLRVTVTASSTGEVGLASSMLPPIAGAAGEALVASCHFELCANYLRNSESSEVRQKSSLRPKISLKQILTAPSLPKKTKMKNVNKIFSIF